MVPARERLQLVPSLSLEGTLQAEEVVRRMLCFGPFADASPCIGGHGAKRIVKEQFRVHSGGAFYAWLASKIGVWLDYTCMPQRPLSAKDEPEFRRSLAALDSLVMSSTVVALRQADDDYAVRGWCASEFFLASNRSFSRGLFLDMARIENGKEVLIPDPPAPAGGAADAATKAVMMESYEQDLTAFHEACSQWSSFEGPLLDITVPDPWSSYRALQGSSFQAGDSDPNPFRRALEAIRGIETGLIENWLMSEQSRTIHIGKDVWDALQRVGLHCSEPSDLTSWDFSWPATAGSRRSGHYSASAFARISKLRGSVRSSGRAGLSRPSTWLSNLSTRVCGPCSRALRPAAPLPGIRGCPHVLAAILMKAP